MRNGVDGGEGERRSKKPVINNDDPVQKMFGEISVYLDGRHDKREKLVKLSRDVTIESKRIIFCLHRFVQLSCSLTPRYKYSNSPAWPGSRLRRTGQRCWTRPRGGWRS